MPERPKDLEPTITEHLKALPKHWQALHLRWRVLPYLTALAACGRCIVWACVTNRYELLPWFIVGALWAVVATIAMVSA